MALKGKELNKDNEQRRQNCSERKLRIVQDKERARVWAENRRLHCEPLVLILPRIT